MELHFYLHQQAITYIVGMASIKKFANFYGPNVAWNPGSEQEITPPTLIKTYYCVLKNVEAVIKFSIVTVPVLLYNCNILTNFSAREVIYENILQVTLETCKNFMILVNNGSPNQNLRVY